MDSFPDSYTVPSLRAIFGLGGRWAASPDSYTVLSLRAKCWLREG